MIEIALRAGCHPSGRVGNAGDVSVEKSAAADRWGSGLDAGVDCGENGEASTHAVSLKANAIAVAFCLLLQKSDRASCRCRVENPRAVPWMGFSVDRPFTRLDSVVMFWVEKSRRNSLPVGVGIIRLINGFLAPVHRDRGVATGRVELH